VSFEEVILPAFSDHFHIGAKAFIYRYSTDQAAMAELELVLSVDFAGSLIVIKPIVGVIDLFGSAAEKKSIAVVAGDLLEVPGYLGGIQLGREAKGMAEFAIIVHFIVDFVMIKVKVACEGQIGVFFCFGPFLVFGCDSMAVGMITSSFFIFEVGCLESNRV